MCIRDSVYSVLSQGSLLLAIVLVGIYTPCFCINITREKKMKISLLCWLWAKIEDSWALLQLWISNYQTCYMQMHSWWHSSTQSNPCIEVHVGKCILQMFKYIGMLRGLKDWVLPLQSYQQISCGCCQLNACVSNLHIIIHKYTWLRFIATTVSHVTTSSYEW